MPQPSRIPALPGRRKNRAWAMAVKFMGQQRHPTRQSAATDRCPADDTLKWHGMIRRNILNIERYRSGGQPRKTLLEQLIDAA